MIGAIAGQGGFDPKKMTSATYTVGGGTATAYTNICNVNGSGILNSIFMHSYRGGYLKVIIDGVTYAEIREQAGNYIATLNYVPMAKFSSNVTVQYKVDVDFVSNAGCSILLD